jgi:hypothetical protein
VAAGKTSETAAKQARWLLELSDTDHVVGLSDRAILAVRFSTAARVGAWPSSI